MILASPVNTVCFKILLTVKARRGSLALKLKSSFRLEKESRNPRDSFVSPMPRRALERPDRFRLNLV
jgi:hypothetical protein